MVGMCFSHILSYSVVVSEGVDGDVCCCYGFPIGFGGV